MNIVNPITEFAGRGLWLLALSALLASLALSAPAQAQNQPATGMPGIQYETGITRPTDDSRIFGTMGTMADEDGLTISNIDRDMTWRWSVADTHNGTYTAHPNTTSPFRMRRFIPADADVGKFLQVCASFRDDAGNNEELCRRISMSVLDVDDPAQVGGAHEGFIEVFVTATAAKPYVFNEDDLVFIDNDGDTVTGFRIITLPSAGTLRLNGMPTGGSCEDPFVEVSRANIGTLTYFPAAGQSPTKSGSYAFFAVQALSSGADYNDPCIMHNHTLNQISIRLVTDPDSATGEPAVTYASGINAPTEDSPITANQGSIMDTNNDPPTALGDIRWQWSQADGRDGAYADITGATDAAFTPGDNQVGKFLRVCASFTDEDDNDEERCLRIEDAVVNINDDPTGAVSIGGIGGSIVSEHEELSVAGNIDDADGFDPANVTYQWQQVASPSTPTADAAWADIAGAESRTFASDHAQVGHHLRACVLYTDNQGTAERVCSGSIGPIVNANDAPVAAAATVSVSVAASAEDPYRFSVSDFRFDDEDGDALESVTFVSLPAVGGLLVGESAADIGQMVNRADIPTIGYYPADNQSPNPNYASFRFNVTDDGDGPGGDDTDAARTSNAATITISLVSAEPMPATGNPAITGGPARQGAALSAGLGTVKDVNGIDTDTIMWRWQAVSPSTSTGTEEWDDIPGATNDAFTPGQAQVGMHLRVCIRFMDNHSAPANEGPLCSAATDPVVNVNDAPVATDDTYTVDIAPGTPLLTDFRFIIPPQAFRAAYDDADGDRLASVTITKLPPGEHGGLLEGSDPAGTMNTQILADSNNAPIRPAVFRVSEDGEQFVDDDGRPRFLHFSASLLFLSSEAGFVTDETTFKFTLSDGALSSNEATLTIRLVTLQSGLRLRLRLFLEGPLR